VVLAARTALVLHDVLSHRWTGRTRRSWEQTVERVLADLVGVERVLPR
jgi:hypothetical protein